MPPVRAAGCARKSWVSGPSTISSRATPRSPSRTRPCVSSAPAARRCRRRAWSSWPRPGPARSIGSGPGACSASCATASAAPAGPAPPAGSGAAPALILVRPQLADNIGMTARAMANFGLERAAARHPARRLAQREGAHCRLRRQLHRRWRRGLPSQGGARRPALGVRHHCPPARSSQGRADARAGGCRDAPADRRGAALRRPVRAGAQWAGDGGSGQRRCDGDGPRQSRTSPPSISLRRCC